MIRFIILILLFSTIAFAQPATISPPVEITEEDAAPSTFPYKIKFENGNVTDNGDGTVSIAGGGGGACWEASGAGAIMPVSGSCTDTLWETSGANGLMPI